MNIANPVTAVLIFIVGTMIGSVLNNVIYRYPKGKPDACSPAHCIITGIKPKLLELIPIVGYIALKAKCNACGKRISIRYPLIEAIHGLLYLFTFLMFGFSFLTLQAAVFLSLLFAIFMIDYEKHVIPDSLNLSIFIWAVLSAAVSILFFDQGLTELLYRLYGLFIGGGLFLLIALVTRGGMGGGDIKLMAALGFFFGFYQTLLVIILSFVIGGVLSAILLALKLKKRKDHIPFGPFICIAAFIVIFLKNL